MPQGDQDDDRTPEAERRFRDWLSKHPGEGFLMVDIPETLAEPGGNPKLAQRLAFYELLYSVVGLFLGLVCALLGFVLLVHGATGSTGWVVEVLGLKSSLSDAAPGTVFVVVGVAAIYLTHFRVRVTKSKES